MIFIFGAAFDPPHVGHSAIIRALLYFLSPEKIIIIPSGKRDDKTYFATDSHRRAMIDIFVEEIQNARVEVDYYFLDTFRDEMITRDVDVYARSQYGDDIVHVFWTDTITSMPEWDEEQYAAKQIRKLFVPRGESRKPEFRIQAQEFSELSSDVLYSRFWILNSELFTDSHIPDVSSTEIRQIIPEYTTLKYLFEGNPKYIIPGLSKRISQYILENRLYRPVDVKPKVLVHICCWPDAVMPILDLQDEYEVICFWYDPNIQPKEEHDKRYEAFVRVCELENIPYIKGAYDVKHFFRRIRGFEDTPEKGEKCTNCYDMRMYVAAKIAKKLNILYYTSSLNTSPKKDLEKLFKIGHYYANRFWIEFLDIPFRKRGGFENSVVYTREHDIYRQNYCGCIYSLRDGGGMSG